MHINPYMGSKGNTEVMQSTEKNKGTNRSHRSNDNDKKTDFATHKYSIHCNFVSELDVAMHSRMNSSENMQLPTPIGKPQKDGCRLSSRLREYYNFPLGCSKSPSLYQRPR